MKTYKNKRYTEHFPDGPWQDEPDKAVWIDESTDLDCMIHRGAAGALCGYVGVGPNHPLHEVDYDTLHVEVHGGLTFSAKCDSDATEEDGICHVPEPGRPHDVWWFGFDCAHMYDFMPVDLLFTEKPDWKTYRDFDFVKSQVTHLAHQIRDYKTVS